MKIGTFINHGTVVEIESVQTMNLHIDKGQVCFGENGLQEVIRSAADSPQSDTDTTAVLPDVLSTPQAEALLAKLCDAGMLDAHWQPVGLTNTERGLLAKILSDELGIDTPWKVFGDCWQVNSGTLRTAYNQALNQRKSLHFQDRLKAVMA